MRDKKEECVDIERGGKSSDEPRCAAATGGDVPTVRPRTSARKLLRRIAIMSTLMSVLVALGALVYYYMGWISLVQLILVAIIAYVIAGKKYEWFIVALRTVPRDAV